MESIRTSDLAGRAARILLLAATGVILGLAVAVFVQIWSSDSQLGNVGEDYASYVSLGRRWLDTGLLYGDRQLTGLPYHIEINVDNLYPPPAILLFAAFVFLPWFAWYLIPIGLVAFAIWRARPALWTWPLMALCVLWPRTQGSFVVGNTDLWSAGFVAAGLVWNWPSVLGLFKPAFAPVVLIGIRRRSWWLTLAVGSGHLCALPAELAAIRYGSHELGSANHQVPAQRSHPSHSYHRLDRTATIRRDST